MSEAKFSGFQKSAPKELPSTKSNPKATSVWDLGTKPLDYFAEILANHSRDITGTFVEKMEELLKEIAANRQELAKLTKGEERLVESLSFLGETKETLAFQKAQLAETAQFRHSIGEMAEGFQKLKDEIKKGIEKDHDASQALLGEISRFLSSQEALLREGFGPAQLAQAIEVVSKEGHKATAQREEILAVEKKVLVEIMGMGKHDIEVLDTLGQISGKIDRIPEILENDKTPYQTLNELNTKLGTLIDQQSQITQQIAKSSQQHADFMTSIKGLLEGVAKTTKEMAALSEKQRKYIDDLSRFSRRDWFLTFCIVGFVIFVFLYFVFGKGAS